MTVDWQALTVFMYDPECLPRKLEILPCVNKAAYVYDDNLATGTSLEGLAT